MQQKNHMIKRIEQIKDHAVTKIHTTQYNNAKNSKRIQNDLAIKHLATCKLPNARELRKMLIANYNYAICYSIILGDEAMNYFRDESNKIIDNEQKKQKALINTIERKAEKLIDQVVFGEASDMIDQLAKFQKEMNELQEKAISTVKA
jgi:hypothetical protein